jgi:hypothetical protein
MPPVRHGRSIGLERDWHAVCRVWSGREEEEPVYGRPRVGDAFDRGGTDRPGGPWTMFAILKGLGLGAGMMYLLDPEHGEHRWEMISGQITETAHEVTEWFDEAIHDPANHATGLLAAAAGGLIGVTLLSRRPLTALALGAVGLTLASRRSMWRGGQNRIPQHYPGDYSGSAGSERSREFDPSELAHYGAGGAGHTGGRQQSSAGPYTGTSS